MLEEIFVHPNRFNRHACSPPPPPPREARPHSAQCIMFTFYTSNCRFRSRTFQNFCVCVCVYSVFVVVCMISCLYLFLSLCLILENGHVLFHLSLTTIYLFIAFRTSFPYTQSHYETKLITTLCEMSLINNNKVSLAQCKYYTLHAVLRFSKRAPCLDNARSFTKYTT